MVRLLYRVYRIASAARYWLTRRLTPAGWMVLIGMLFTAGLGVDIQQAMAYQAFALLAALMAMAIAASVTFRGRFEVERRLPRFGTVGQPMVYTAAVRNLSKQLQAGLVLIEEVVDPRPGLEEFRRLLKPARRAKSFSVEASRIDIRRAELRPQPLPTLLPGAETEVRVDLLPLKRGTLRFTAAVIGRADPLGLFRALLREPLPSRS